MEALFFLDHVSKFRRLKLARLIAWMHFRQFIGDIGQPLHVEALDVGGNTIPTICGGKHTHLHATWDTGMIVTMVDATFNGDTQSWASSLVQEIKTGSFRSLAAKWISCSSTTDVLPDQWRMEDDVQKILGTRHSLDEFQFLACPLVWARESNAIVCVRVVRRFIKIEFWLMILFLSQMFLILLMARIFAKALTSTQISRS